MTQSTKFAIAHVIGLIEDEFAAHRDAYYEHMTTRGKEDNPPESWSREKLEDYGYCSGIISVVDFLKESLEESDGR